MGQALPEREGPQSLQLHRARRLHVCILSLTPVWQLEQAPWVLRAHRRPDSIVRSDDHREVSEAFFVVQEHPHLQSEIPQSLGLEIGVHQQIHHLQSAQGALELVLLRN